MLVAALIVTVCSGLAVFAVTDQWKAELADAHSATRFLARQSEPLLHWDDRVALQSLMSELVESRETLACGLIERNGRALVEVGEASSLDTLLTTHAGETGEPAAADVVLVGRQPLVDVAVQANNGSAAIHLGLSRKAVRQKASPRLVRIAATGFAAALLGCVLAWGVASTTTREVAAAQTALQESEERFRCLFEQAAEGAGGPAPGTYVELEVNDDGAGIEPHHLDVVFEPVFTTKAGEHGAGLGLSMVAGVVRRLGGTVTVESQPGSGTSVRVLLPSEERAGPAQQLIRRSAVDTVSGERCVLLVDDEPLLRWAVLSHLRKRGFQVLEAANGQTAIEIFQQERDSISLVLLDMVMPVKNGRETFKDLTDLGITVPIILQSGSVRDETIDKLLHGGARAFIQKPYELDQLTELIEDVLGGADDITKR